MAEGLHPWWGDLPRKTRRIAVGFQLSCGKHYRRGELKKAPQDLKVAIKGFLEGNEQDLGAAREQEVLTNEPSVQTPEVADALQRLPCQSVMISIIVG
jgi:hypothetical protein